MRRRFSFWLQDRGRRHVEFLNRTRSSWRPPESARSSPTSTASGALGAEIYADINRTSESEAGRRRQGVYQTLRRFLGGIYVNQFNRLGRQWKVFLQAEAEGRVRSRTSTSFT
jgi:multidrug efflux pump subunit AcrB